MASKIPNPLEQPTLAVEGAADLFDTGRNAAYAEIKATGTFAGVEVIRIGRKIRIPTRPLLQALGLDDQ